VLQSFPLFSLTVMPTQQDRPKKEIGHFKKYSYYKKDLKKKDSDLVLNPFKKISINYYNLLM
jgi:hypothetical protein